MNKDIFNLGRKNGSAATSGANGANRSTGTSGPSGASGASSASGAPSASGATGTNGKTGASGSERIARVNRKDIAIIGMGGRWPGANNLRQFWNNLAAGKDSIAPFPAERIAE